MAAKRQRVAPPSPPFGGRYRRALVPDRRFAGLDATAGEAHWSGDFSFVQLADPQLGMYRDNARWEEEVAYLRAAARFVNRVRPKFVVVCGDLIHAFPHADPDLRRRQTDAFKEALAEVDESIPLVCVCGNHDIGNRPTRATVERYEADFGSAACRWYNSPNGCKPGPSSRPIARRQGPSSFSLSPPVDA